MTRARAQGYDAFMTLRIACVACVLPLGCFGEAPDVGDGGDASSDSGGTTGSATQSTSAPTVTSGDATATSEETVAPESGTTDDATITTDPDSTSTGTGDVQLLDLDVDACTALWQNAMGGTLDCPFFDMEAPAFMDGHVYRATDSPVFVQTLGDDMVIGEDAFVTHPNFQADGQIVGIFPPLPYQDGDRFGTTVTCAQNTSCDVVITIGARVDGNSEVMQLDQLTLTFADEGGKQIDVEMPPGGTSVELYLYVEDGMMVGSDTVVWLGPEIVRPG